MLVELAVATPALRAQLPLPPSERDFELYGLVVTEGASTRAAAQTFGLSQTRVIQIRDRVAEWIASEVPPLARATPAQRLALAADIARHRFDFLYSQAMDAWRGSKGPQTTLRAGGSGGETSSTRESQGEPRYLILAARIAERTVGLGAAIEKAMANREQGTGDREPGTGDKEQELGARGLEVQCPPVRDCSPLAGMAEVPAQVEPKSIAASQVTPVVSDETKRKRRDFFRDLNEVAVGCSAEPKASRGIGAAATIPR
jgi:hypothetical protein